MANFASEANPVKASPVAQNNPLPTSLPPSALDRPGDVVELKDLCDRGSEHLPRGDFLLLACIKEDIETGEVFLEGYKLRRTTHIAPTFNSKLQRNLHDSC